MIPGVVFTMLPFLYNLQMGPISERVCAWKPFQPIGYEHSSLMGQIISYEQNEVLWIWSQELYSQCFLIITYQWAHQAGGFVLGKSFQPSVWDHSSLLGQFICYKQNEVLWIWSQVSYSQCFLFITYQLAQQAGGLDLESLSKLVYETTLAYWANS